MASWPTPIAAYSATAAAVNPFDPVDWATAALQYLENITTTEEWRKVMLIWSDNTAGGISADQCVTTLDLTNITGGALDSSWTTGDYTTCEGLMDTFVTAFKPYTQQRLKFTGYRWYKRQFTDVPSSPLPAGTRDEPFKDSGPPTRITTKSVTSTSTQVAVPQSAITVTKRTPWPHHWGRNYLPGIGAESLDITGRIKPAACDAIALAFHNLVTGLAAADFQVVVPCTQFDKDPIRALLQITSISVDDVVDVHRSRRLKYVGYRGVKP